MEGNKETLRFPKNPDYLMPMQILQKVFKAKFIEELQNLEFYDSVAPKAWRKDWIVHCQSVGNGQTAIKYLSAYTQKIFISGKRVEYDSENVTYSYIDSNTGKKKTYNSRLEIHYSLPATCFTLRLHENPSLRFNGKRKQKNTPLYKRTARNQMGKTFE